MRQAESATELAAEGDLQLLLPHGNIRLGMQALAITAKYTQEDRHGAKHKGASLLDASLFTSRRLFLS
jgi:hypothetical protein